MRSGKQALAVAGTVILVTAGAAACGAAGGSHPAAKGSPGGSPGAGHAVEVAYTDTMNAKTANFRLDETVQASSSSGSSQSETITGSGQADFATKAFAVSINAPSGGAVKTVLVNGTEYIELPAAARSQIPGHKPWASINLNKVSQARLGKSFAQIASASNDNPTQALSQLSAVSSSVTRAGTATLAGVPTTEYRAQVSLNKVAAEAQAKEGTKAAQLVRQEINALGTGTLPVDIWTDAHHMVRQIRYQVPIPAASTGGSSGSGKAVLTMTFTSFGAPVHLSPPPPSQTADITSQVLQQAKTGSG